MRSARCWRQAWPWPCTCPATTCARSSSTCWARSRRLVVAAAASSALPLIALGSVLMLTRARSLNALLLGEETAAHLGLDVRRERLVLLGAATLVTAAAGGRGGLIGFVGLVVPHLVRLVVGPNAVPCCRCRDLRRHLPGPRRPDRAHTGRAAGRRHHGDRRRAVLPVPAAPLPRGLRAVSGASLEVRGLRSRLWHASRAARHQLDACARRAWSR